MKKLRSVKISTSSNKTSTKDKRKSEKRLVLIAKNF